MCDAVCFFSAISAFASWKTGDSSIVRRTQSPTITRTADSRNGMRQPQALNASSLWTAASRNSTPVASRLPMATPACGHEDQKPRCWSWPCSAAIRTAPPHSPPTAKPCTSRQASSRIGAATPMEAYVGSRPIAIVEMPIISSETTSIFLRPTRSPKCPKTTPPSGRATKPSA